MSWTRKFFKDLSLKIGAGATVSQLRVFIAPFAEQFEALEKEAKSGVARAKFKEAEAEIERLKAALKDYQDDTKTQMEGYQAQLQKAANERERMVRELSALRQTPAEPKQRQRTDDLPKEAARVLVCIAKYVVRCNAAQIAHDLKIPKVRAQHWLDELTGRHMIREAGEGYFLDKKGRAYLVENGLDTESGDPVTSKKYADLPKLEEKILMIVNGWEGDPSGILQGIGTDRILSRLAEFGFKLTLAKLELTLERLDKFVGVNAMTYGNGLEWYPLKPLSEYLDERGKL